MAAMRFVKHKVALDIVTGSATQPELLEHDGWKILRVTYEQMEDYQTCRQIMRQLSALLKSSASKRPEFDSQVQSINKLMVDRSA